MKDKLENVKIQEVREVWELLSISNVTEDGEAG